MEQVAEHHNLNRLQGVADLDQWIESAATPAAGEGDTMGLKRLSLAEVQIGDQKKTLLWVPYSPGPQQDELIPCQCQTMSAPWQRVRWSLRHGDPMSRR